MLAENLMGEPKNQCALPCFSPWLFICFYPEYFNQYLHLLYPNIIMWFFDFTIYKYHFFLVK